MTPVKLRAILTPDRRIVYVLLLIAMAMPLLKPLGIPIPVSQETQTAYDYLEGLDPDARVLVALEYQPSFMAELQAQLIVFLKHLARRGIRTYVITMNPDAGPLALAALDSSFVASQKKSGVDYMFLGFVSGKEAGLASMGDSLASVIATPPEPIMQGVASLADFDLVIPLTSDNLQIWVRQVYTKFGTPIISSTSGVIAAGTVPYVQSGQVVTSLTSQKCAAEYELVSRLPGGAVATMDAQSAAHLVIIVLILLGNIGYYLSKRRGEWEAV